MNELIHVLHLEDHPADALLVEQTLKKGLTSIHCHRVDMLAGLRAAIESGHWHLILADYNIPGLAFDDVLALARCRCPDSPLIVVSGYLGEERAADLLKMGVWDLVLKGSLVRLVPAVRRNLREAKERQGRALAEQSLRTSQQIQAEQLALLTTLIEAIPNPIFYKGKDRRYLGCNRAFAEFLGRAPSEIIGHSELEVTVPPAARMSHDTDSQLLEGGGSQAFEARIGHADGRCRDMLISKATFSVTGTAPDGIVGILIDITERKETERVLLRHANFDSLTELPNRKLGLERLTQAMAAAIENDGEILVIIADLDSFKTINDSLGHALGDQLIVEVARRLVAGVPDSDTVARMVGDEFLMVVSEPELVANADELAFHILKAFQEPMELPTQDVYVNVSLGITRFPGGGTDVHEVLRNADAALSQAKAAGRGCHRVFTPDMDRRAAELLALEHALRHAVTNNELRVYYQPIVDPHAGRLVGAEALVRWHSPTFGIVPPDRFIPVAEDVGLVVAIDGWVLATACRDAALWQPLCPWPLSVSANLSARHFHNRALIETVTAALAASRLPPKCLTLEITERLFVGEGTQTAEVLRRVAEMGVGIAIDDFGIGYSALSYLKRFPLSKLKIDKSFIQDITTDATNASLGKAIINLAHSLNLKVVGEGVETAAHLDFLRANGCDLIQGYYYSRPLPAEDFITFVRAPWMSAGVPRSP